MTQINGQLACLLVLHANFHVITLHLRPSEIELSRDWSLQSYQSFPKSKFSGS